MRSLARFGLLEHGIEATLRVASILRVMQRSCQIAHNRTLLNTEVGMSKTITIRLDDDTYRMIKSAAEGQMRSISNFVEYATVLYLTQEAFASDEEMDQITADTDLVKTLKKASTGIRAKRYNVVE
jgi:predicted transcriptional regulator